MQPKIEAVPLDIFFDTQADDDVDKFQQYGTGDCAPDDRRDDAPGLCYDLTGIAFQQPLGAADRFRREHAGQQGADDAADAMHAEHVERVVVTAGLLEPGRAPVARDARNDPDGQRADRIDEAGCRRDGTEAGDGAGDPLL